MVTLRLKNQSEDKSHLQEQEEIVNKSINIEEPGAENDESTELDALIHNYFFKQTRSIEEILVWATTNNCSDVFIKTLDKPYISRYGKITQLPCVEISKDQWQAFYQLHVLNELNAQYVRQKMLDISVEVRIPDDNPYFGKFDSNYFRYRASFGFSQERNICTFRMIRPSKPTFETINYPQLCADALHVAYGNKTGIIFFTGATGSGKSTSLAACINTFTQPNDVLDNKVIITLEDPIENEFANSDSVKITQKELGVDFRDFAHGIKQALREHPNMVIVGECRDKEVICSAIEAARTGHLVSTSFHASDVAGTISRLLYHLDNDKNLSYDLIINMNIVMSQTLIKNNNGYLIDTQYLIFNDYVTRTLLEIINNGGNIANGIYELLEDADLLDAGIAKNWDYQ